MDGATQAPGMVPTLVGEGARLGIQGRDARSDAPCTMNDDAGFPPGRDRTTGFSAEPRNRDDVDSFIGCGQATGPFERAEESGHPQEGDARSCTKRDPATGT